MSGWSTPSDFKNSKIPKEEPLPETSEQVKTLKKKPKHFHFSINEMRNSNIEESINLVESQYTTAQGNQIHFLTTRGLF
jgi:hypothetical protein